MTCIALVGGLIGCGKTSLVSFFLNNQNELFENSFGDEISDINDPEKSKQNITHKIIFDEICSIKEQAELMKTLKLWRNFRLDLLMAAEFYICSACNFECQVAGPLSERSQNLLDQLQRLNNPITATGRNIFFVEDNFYYRSMRYEWFQIARRNNIGFCEVFVQCPLNMAIYRNSTRGYNIPEQKIKMMLTSMEYPNPVKYKWERYSMVYDSSKELTCSSMKPIVKLIEEAVSNPAELMINEEKIEAQKVCYKSVVHQTDNILRKLVSKKILFFKENISNKNELKSLVSFCNKSKQELLSGIKNGEVDVPIDIFKKVKESGIKNVHQEYEEILNDIFENALQNKMLDLDFISNTFHKSLNLINDYQS